MHGMDDTDDTDHLNDLDTRRTRDGAPASQPLRTLPLDEAPTTRIVPVLRRARAPQPHVEPGAVPSLPLAEIPRPWHADPSVRSVFGALPVDPNAPTMPLAAGSGAPALAANHPPRPRRRLAVLGPPLPPPLATLVFGAALCGIVVAGSTAWLLTEGEWATVARAVGFAALLMGILYVLVTLARLVAESHFSRPVLLGLLAVLVLGTLGGAGLALVRPLHLAQAQALETGQDWSDAIREYQLAGEHGPASRDLARTYLEWGDALRRQGDYASALDRYHVVLTAYPDSGEVARRAEAATLAAYAAWLATSRLDIPYDALLSQLARDASAAWCDASCRTTIAALEPQARYQYGVALAADGRYTTAIAQLEATASRFPASPYAAQAHAAAASAYYALGQSQRASASCTDAVPTFQTLAARYADTPQGVQAKAALAASVPVSGVLLGYPRNPAPTMYLSRRTNRLDYFSDDYSATLDSKGHFTFKQVRPGSYNLSAAFANGRGVFWSNTTTGNAYDVVVGPLCSLTLPTPYTWP
jgi:tetratricopeptide (TPR) repeat protein